MARSDKAICSSVCGARCCKWGVVALTPEEAERLPRLAPALHLPQPEIVSSLLGGEESSAMHAKPCVFLSKSNLCTIYKDRPDHCRAFPDTWREGCLLSVQRFGDRPEPATHSPELRKPRRKEGRSAR